MIEQSDSITFVDTFADRLRLARTARSLTQAALAQACGVSQSAIANYENGSRRSTKTIFRLAETLQVQAQWLAEGKGDMDITPYHDLSHADNRFPPSTPPLLVSDHVRHQWGPWPFQNIHPESYWALDTASRTLIENTVASLMASLKK